MNATRSFQFFSNFLLSTFTKSLRNQNQRWLHPLHSQVHIVHPEKVKVFRNFDAKGKVLWTETLRKKQWWGPAFLSCSFFFKGHYFSLLSNDFSIILQLDMRTSKSSIRLTAESHFHVSDGYSINGNLWTLQRLQVPLNWITRNLVLSKFCWTL